MSEWHLDQLRNALERRGWRIIAEHPGNDYEISASWELARSKNQTTIFIDFEGLDDMITLPIEKSYGCHLRGYGSSSLYFRKRGEGDSKKRQLWQEELNEFIESLKQSV